MGRRKRPKDQESQVKSDALLRKARQIISLVRGGLAGDKNTMPLGHVDHALLELHTALRIK